MKLSISVVSHRQASLVAQLLQDLAGLAPAGIEVILTVNVPEPLDLSSHVYPFDVKVIRNNHVKGFGANHNAAFALANGRFFAVLNPDIRLIDDPFAALCEAAAESGIGVAAPQVLSTAGTTEDSARRFPTPTMLARKLLIGSHRQDYPIAGARIMPDWVAGMFMLFRRESFEAVRGFDQRYFLYYEDVDLCWRLRRAGLAAVVVTAARVVHDARRDSHRKLGYLRHHVSGMTRFFIRRALSVFSAPRA